MAQSEAAGRLLDAAIQTYGRGGVADARSFCRQILALDKSHAAAQHLLGVCERDLGNFQEAERNIRAAMRREPANAIFHMNYGLALLSLGRVPDAQVALQRAIAIEPRLGAAHFNLGLLYEENARYDEAISCYQRAVALDRGPLPRTGIANCLLAQDKADEAIELYRAVLAQFPEHHKARTNLGVALGRSGKFAEAITQVRTVLDRRPADIDAHRNLVALASAGGLLAHALTSILELRAQAPGDSEMIKLQANALADGGRLAEAIGLWEELGRGEPDNPVPVAEAAWLRTGLGCPDEALRIADDAIARFPGEPALWRAKGLAAMHLGDYDAARAHFARALELAAGDATSQFQVAVLDLLHGDLAAGLAGFESRLAFISGAGAARGLNRHPWRGDFEIARGTLLLHSEQGLGDALQFARFIPLARERAGKLVLEVPGPAASLLRRNLPAEVAIVPFGEALPAFDWSCPLMSLPLALRLKSEASLASAPYVLPDLNRVNAWRRRLGAAKKLRVGLSWSGNPSHRFDAMRSLPLVLLQKAFADAGTTGQVEFIGLQNGISEIDRAALESFAELAFLGETITDLEDTAALVADCDLVISVDTSVAHLAGAMGKPLWLLLPFVPDWRWQLSRTDSPWYGSAELFRQAQRGDWPGVLAIVADRLRNRIEQRQDARGALWT